MPWLQKLQELDNVVVVYKDGDNISRQVTKVTRVSENYIEVVARACGAFNVADGKSAEFPEEQWLEEATAEALFVWKDCTQRLERRQRMHNIGRLSLNDDELADICAVLDRYQARVNKEREQAVPRKAKT